MTSHQTVLLLVDLALILVLARMLGALATKLGQPAVIGEILAGILVGPTLFGGSIANTLFPLDVRPFLTALANVGVAVFMFIIGLELDTKLLRGKGKIASTVSSLSMVLPFVLGVTLALYLVRNHTTTGRLGFVLFMGAAMSVTAFPVLARILRDRGMHHTPLGVLALACAAVDDVLAWSLLAVVVAVAGAGGPGQLLILGVIPYVALMFGVVRPLLRWLAARRQASEGLTAGVLATVLAGLLLSGGLTEWIGLHFIFGAFLFGIIMPREGAEQLRSEIGVRVGHVNGVLLLPVFFIVAGLKVDLSKLGWAGLGELGLVLVVAIGGKFLGAFLGARAHGMPARESAALATLMNTRGLTELIILSVGLQRGVLDADLYTVMVVMAVVTTAMAGPLLGLIYPQRIFLGDHGSDRAVTAPV
jgi:Kef-type K+ transport system membrane component KefB